MPKKEKDSQVKSPRPFVSSIHDCLGSTSSADEVMQYAEKMSENDIAEIEIRQIMNNGSDSESMSLLLQRNMMSKPGW